MKIAILDLYEGEVNEGMRCILQLVEFFGKQNDVPVEYQVFDVRLKNEIADLSFDAYISSGGPGSPNTSQGSEWESRYFALMDALLRYNSANPFQRKHVILICHSFQIFCRYYGYAKVTRRKSTAFGIMPVHKTKEGQKEPLFKTLADPFFAVESRDYQIVQPDQSKIWAGGGNILCIEKDRPLIPLERAVMAIRFNEAFFGTQFHPEADSESIFKYLVRDDKKKMIIDKHGERKYQQMLGMINESDKVRLTYKTVIPKFLKSAMDQFKPVT